MPPQQRIVLNQKRIFILPTWMGIGYLTTAFLLFIAGINYDNGLILNFSFFLGSLFVVAILQTFSNLSGLVISAGNTEPSFASTEAKFIVHFSKSKKKEHHSIGCWWEGYQSEPQNLVKSSQTRVTMLLPTSKRGLFRPQRLRIETVYPFGLCRAWTWVDLTMSCLVYPKPIECEPLTQLISHQKEGSNYTSDGNEDFDGLRAYNTSDSLKTVDWKAFARRNTLYTKQFHGYQAQSNWITWDQMPSSNPEMKLSQMCYWVIQLAKTNDQYGLRFPTVDIKPGQGKQHEQACLEALARY